ncbi:hypothetical protein VTH82DRAFT_7062 [Thermothelomyces myriococcoides]
MAIHSRPALLAIGMISAAAVSAQHVLLPFSQHRDIALSARASERGTLKSNAGYAYVIDAAVGTPPQNLSLLISTTAGDTWVPDANTRECSPQWYYRTYYDGYFEDNDDCTDTTRYPSMCQWGSFNASLSSTYLPPNPRYEDFRASYADSSYVSGDNMTDRLVFGGIELDDYPMGLVSLAHRWIGVLGLGYNSSSSYYAGSSLSGLYDNVIDRMVLSGKIASPAYSIWLDDAQGSSGNLLFGAVDRSRYSGDLVRLSTGYTSYSYSYGFSVTLNSVNGTSASGAPMPAIRTNDFPVDVVLGHGEVFSFLPDLLADQIAAMAGATFNESLGYFTIPCNAGERNNTKFVFEIGGDGGPKLNTETVDLVQPSIIYSDPTWSGQLLESDMCLFAIQKYDTGSSSSSSYDYLYNLGGSILRRTYVVYDLANHEIAVAPVKFQSDGSTPTPEIKAFESYGAYTPDATELCTSSYCGSNYGGSGSDHDSDDRPYDSHDWHDPGLDYWTKIAVGVGVSFGTVALVGAVAGIILCRLAGRGKGAAAKNVDEEDSAGNATPTGSTSPAVAQIPVRGSTVALPGPLPAIQEQPEAQIRETQPPVSESQVTQPDATSEPTKPANPNTQSAAVPAPSGEQTPQNAVCDDTSAPEASTAAPTSPKGKGKEVVRTES